MRMAAQVDRCRTEPLRMLWSGPPNPADGLAELSRAQAPLKTEVIGPLLGGGSRRVERVIKLRQVVGALILVAGFASHSSLTRAESSCPFAMWRSHGTCCELGLEYVPSKGRCMRARPERRCVAGHLEACVAAGEDLERRSTLGASYAAEFYRYACDEGYSPGCRGLAALYDKGVGVKRDRPRALRLWEDACAQGDARSCTILAHALFDESETKGQVMTLLRIGCHRGDALACSDYARRVSTDPAQHEAGARYFERACRGGVGEACLALIEHERRTMSADPRRERELTEQACQAGESQSCILLGRLGPMVQPSEAAGTGRPRHLPVRSVGATR